MPNTKLAKAVLAAVGACTASLAFSGAVLADDAADNKALKEQLRSMQQQMNEMQKKVDAVSTSSAAHADAGAAAKTSSEPKFDKFAKGFYGTLDVSLDYTTKGIDGMVAYPYALANPTNPYSGGVIAGGPKTGPQGRIGWMPALSTNKSALGYRGSHKISGTDFDLIYQLEVQPQITNAPGTGASYNTASNVTKGGIGYGDSFVGISSNTWGKLKLGTTYSPYKKSTDRMNPFSGMLGDYGAIMGNSGGDNRVEFGSRLDHSMWFESPKIGNVFSFDMLWSPGQQRVANSLAQSAGSSDCNGGNTPGSGNLPMSCDDGGFDTAYSMDVKFEFGGWYMTAAYEIHKAVNRNSDGIGANNLIYGYYLGQGNGVSPLLDWNGYNAFAAEYPQAAGAGSPGYVGDIGNETAAKVGLQYTTSFGLVLSGIYEDLRRYIPQDLMFQNERQRHGTWFAASQDFGPKDNVSIGWAHASATPGDPGGQHNYNPNNADNHADMYTIAWKHKFEKNLYWYLDAADTVNAGNAHYDIGAGGRGITTDCHDGTTFQFNDYSSAGPTTWGGCHILGFSTGLNYKF